MLFQGVVEGIQEKTKRWILGKERLSFLKFCQSGFKMTCPHQPHPLCENASNPVLKIPYFRGILIIYLK
jgi:hypothetical protein